MSVETTAFRIADDVRAGRARAVDVLDAHLANVTAREGDVHARHRPCGGGRGLAPDLDASLVHGIHARLAGVAMTVEEAHPFAHAHAQHGTEVVCDLAPEHGRARCGQWVDQVPVRHDLFVPCNETGRSVGFLHGQG